MILPENIRKFEGLDSEEYEMRERKKREFQEILREQLEEKKRLAELKKREQFESEKREEARMLAENQRIQQRIEKEKKKTHVQQNIQNNAITHPHIIENGDKNTHKTNLQSFQNHNEKYKNYNLILNTQISQKYIDSSKEDKKYQSKTNFPSINDYQFPTILPAIKSNETYNNHNSYNIERKNDPHIKTNNKENNKVHFNLNKRKVDIGDKIIKNRANYKIKHKNQKESNYIPHLHKYLN